MPTVNLSALAGAGQQFFDNNGIPLAGGKLYSYAAGTTTPQTTYTSAAGSVSHTNPIILDSAGRIATGEIWVTAGQNYKFVLKTSAEITLATWDNITGINGTGIASNAANVEYDPPYSGSVATTVEAELAQCVSVLNFGADPTGATDSTVAIQNAVNSLTNLAGPGKLIFPRGTYVTTSAINFPIAWARNTIDFMGSIVRYDGPISVNAAMFTFNRLVNSNAFLNGYLNANNRAGFIFYAVAAPFGGDIASIKKNTVFNCSFQYPTVGCVTIGNQTADGNDLDGADWAFENTYFTHNTPSFAVKVDGDNCFNTLFKHCWFNADSGVSAGPHLLFYKGSSYYMYDNFFGNLANTSDFCIELREGNLTVVGANTEEGSILYTQGMVAERKNIYLANIMVNEGTASATPEYAIYAPVGQISLHSCTFGKADIFPRKIYAGDALFAENVYLGSNAAGTVYGTYELDYPDRCFVEGQYLNNVNVLNGNNNFALWSGASSNDYPFGYQSSGYGTFTVTQNNAYTAQGQYCALVAVSNGYATGNDIDGLQAVVPFNSNQFNGSRNILAVVKGFATGLTGTSTLKLQVKFIDAGGGTYGSNNVTVTPAVADGAFTAMISATPSGVAGPTHVAATIGTGVAGAAANIYVTAFYMFPIYPFTVNGGAHYKSYVDAWTKYPKQLDGFAEYAKAGHLVAGSGTTVQRIDWGAAAPSSGTWTRGDVVFNSSATSGGAAGWMCVASGTPGTWKAMANLA